MPANSGSVFSETLQEITNTKLEELSKRRSEFETTKASIVARLENETDPLKRLALLSRGVKDSYTMKTTKTGEILPGQSKNLDLELELRNLDSFMAQSRYDPSITPQLMRSWEESLLRHLDTQSSKFEFASLYAQLVTEWLSTEKAALGAGEDVNMTDGFEDIGDSMKKEARRGWEQVVFEPAGVDEGALKTYLVDLFGLQEQVKPAKAKSLEKLREKLTAFENTLAAPKQFNPHTLKWVIKGLLASDLLTDERREVLRDFLGNQTILTEVADVLNMRLAALSTWSWGESVALEQQRKITGIYNVLMHEDVLQAIFLHYIGVKWSVFLKGAFRQFRKYDGAWESSRRPIPLGDQKRRTYYMGPEYVRHHNSVQALRDNMYRNHYFMANLMGHDEQKQQNLEGEEEADYSVAQAGPHLYQQQPMMAMAMPRAMAAPPPPPLTAARKQKRAIQAGAWHSYGQQTNPDPYDMDATEESDDSDDDTKDRRPMEDKQRLIRLLSTEIVLNTKLHTEVTAFHSVFEGWNSLLPHETILAVMSHLGVSETWIDFFTKFLKAPLKFLDDSPATGPRTRRRGTPASHVLSEVFGESILFCLDFSVNQATRGYNLHRMHDDFWFWSRDHEIAKTAWEAVSDFVNATRTYIDFAKSGTVRISRDPSLALEIDESLPAGDIRWGFLKLSTKTGKFEIDELMVDKHIVDLRRQLADKRKSVISFIQTWNTFAATFFTSNFGNPANCFGRDHVDQILATHERIQRQVFSSSSSPPSLLAGEAQPKEPITGVVGYLKHLLCTRFGVSGIPDAYLFFPIELGGLDLRSPFISILPVREAVVSDPGTVIDTFLEAERDDYARKKLAFERGDHHNNNHRQSQVSRARGPWEPEDPSECEHFMAFEEYARYREDLDYRFANNLSDVFEKLLKAPQEEGGICSANAGVRAAIEALARSSSHPLKGITGDWTSMDTYWRWVAQLYGPEAVRRFGGLDIVEPGLLPMGMVSLFRDKRVKWQG
ncbi:hypothetical protein SAMD00023353_7100570 [Rosellinia necatrix]|uniref:Reverse transcriptase n=1 Tax=Rosellinia necatrix TaxID=77044 RepID=A0A1W2TT70_ROSNE|nr:hypothetical protein SAMD00023353_7100570 [Rosellinia necatrix]